MRRRIREILGRKRAAVKTENVLIVVLAGGETVHPSLLQLASECDSFSALDSHRFIVTCVPITATPQELARNTACGMALKQLKRPTDTLLMIDNDMVQHGWRSLQILETPEYDIAGGLQYMWLPADYEGQRPPEARPCVFKRKPEGERGQICIYPEPEEEYRAVDRVGSGFMAIKRRVLEEPRMLLAPDPELEPPPLWRNVYLPNFVRTKGLDMDFCDRASALGYRVVVNWKAEIGHRKHVNVNEIDMYAKQQFALGYALGEQHGVSMAGRSSGTAEGADRDAGPVGAGNGRLAEPRVDRPALQEAGAS